MEFSFFDEAYKRAKQVSEDFLREKGLHSKFYEIEGKVDSNEVPQNIKWANLLNSTVDEVSNSLNIEPNEVFDELSVRYFNTKI